jgi:hypothetical protein
VVQCDGLEDDVDIAAELHGQAVAKREERAVCSGCTPESRLYESSILTSAKDGVLQILALQHADANDELEPQGQSERSHSSKLIFPSPRQ